MNKFRVLTLTMLFLVCSSVQAERYYTWIDETGAVRHTLIPEENPILQRAEEVRRQAEKAETGDGPEGGAGAQRSGSGLSGEEISDRQLAEIAEDPETVPEISEVAGPDSAVSEVVNTETLAAGKAELPDAVSPAVKETDTVAATYSTDDYIDAAELARRGYIREGQESRFYTWVDQNGIIYNSPYPPAEEEASSEVQQEPEFHASPFMVEERVDTMPAASLAEVDGFARKLFQLDQKPQGRLQQFGEACCRALPFTEIAEIDVENGYTIEFGNEHESYAFSTGNSVYELIRLPVSQRSYSLQVRSFINDQLFFPSLVFLDEKFKPRRIVSNVIYEYEPENWFRYGFLEGWVDVETHRGERYLLVLSTKEDLKKQTTVERRKKQVQYRHGQHGLIHLSVAKPLQI